MSIQLGSAYGKVIIDSSGVTSGVNSSIKSLEGLEQIAQKIGGGMQKIGAAMTVGLTLPITAFFASSVRSALDAESALAEVEAVLKSTGGAAGVTADQIKEMSSELQKVTKFSDEEIMSGQSMLLTFTKIGEDVFPLATEAMLNMAEKFGNVQNASVQLGKALNDPIAGVGALRRVGVMLTDEQEKQIKAFMAVNDIASAQKVILKELEVEFGGLAKAAGSTTAGQFAQLKNAFDDLKEVAGQAIIPILLKLAEAATKMIEAFMDMPSWMQKSILVLLALVALAGPVIAFMGTIVSLIGSILGAVSYLGSMGISLGAVASAAGTAGTALVGVGASALLLLGQILLLAAGPVLLYLAFKNNFMGITDTVKQLWFIIKYYFAQITKWISDTFRKINWSAIGKAMLIGLANGMLGGLPMIIMAASRIATAALEAMKTKLGIHSPSAEFKKLGEFSGQGFSEGLSASLSNLRQNVKSALSLQLDFFSSYFKDVDSLNKNNTKNHEAAMKAQVQATIQALAIQAAAMAKYKAAAAKFWSGKGIPMGQASSNLGNSASSIAPFMEQITNPGWDPSVMQEQVKPVNVEKTKPVKVEIVQNFASGVTVRQAQQMINNSKSQIFKELGRMMGGA